MIGQHFIKGWSKTQASITLSSAEAELVAMCKLAAEVIGLGSLAIDLGRDVQAVLHADSSAAIAISKRRGSGKLRHINVGLLWIQERTETGDLVSKKVKGVSNPSDMMTKNVNKEKQDKYMEMVRQKNVGGRAQEGLCLQKGERQDKPSETTTKTEDALIAIQGEGTDKGEVRAKRKSVRTSPPAL